jgi:DNA repair exonuclease SbcCD ATPase subunit
MHLETLKINEFGCLRTTVTFVPESLNLAIADNEAGKSTLIAAILAALYGIVEDERVTRDKRPRRKNVLPWDNPEEFGLTLEFTLNDIRWSIERDFNTGVVHLIDRDTGKDHVSDYHKGKGIYHIGEELIGLTCTDFLKSFYMRQDEILEIRDAGGLTPHVQRIASARDGGSTSENAIESLRNALRRYPYPGSKNGITVDTVLSRNKKEKENLESELDGLERSRAKIQPSASRLASIESDINRLIHDGDEAERLSDQAEINELSELCDRQERLKLELSELEAVAEELNEFGDFPAGKGEQLIKLAVKIENLTASIEKVQAKLNDEVIPDKSRIDVELKDLKGLRDMSTVDLRNFEDAVSKHTDRYERRTSAEKDVEKINKEIEESGIDRNNLRRLQSIFDSLDPKNKIFIDEFRATYAEEEMVYRESKAQREWIERDRAQIMERKNRISGNARMFFIIAAVLALSGGILILLTQGEWLGQILAGIGAVLGAIGAFTFSSVGGADSSRLSQVDEDLEAAIITEDESSNRMENIGKELTDIAERLEFTDGNQLLADYLAFDRMQHIAEPLMQAENLLDKSKAETDDALKTLQPFFKKAGENVTGSETANHVSESILNKYRDVVRLGEEMNNLNSKDEEYRTELDRLGKNYESNLDLCGEILQLGNVEVTDPLDDAIDEFHTAGESHHKYRSVVDKQLPRVKEDLLDEIDIKAKQDRLTILRDKLAGLITDDPVDHSKEYYRDTADKLNRERDDLMTERQEISRTIGTAFDNYQQHQPIIAARIDEISQNIASAETFRSEIEKSLSIMSEISQDVYKSWASALSEEAAPILKKLNPRYDELLFNEDLTFSVLDTVNNRVINSDEVDNVLSTGAREEVFLAARLGISSYLARGSKGAIPIVLDEPLAAADDDKFQSGMEFFMKELSKKHQILIMSCHEERHNWLAKNLPDAWKKRVHLIELNSA